MNGMIKRTFARTCLLVVLLTGCIPQPTDVVVTFTPGVSGADATGTAALPSATPFEATPTTTVAPLPVPPDVTPSQGAQQLLAYVSNGHLLVSDVSNGVLGGTTQYTLAGESDQVSDVVWSPAGDFVAFVSSASGTPRVFYIYALGQSSPTDMGAGSAPAWSPDSTGVAYIGGAYPDENIYIATIENPTPRQLTFESNYAWGRPAFTPDGASLIVAGADRNNMGAQGNTSFTLESLALDGSGTRTPLPGASPIDGARLPYDLRLSPDGSRLAFSTSYHWSACASPGSYYVSSPDGSGRQELVSPSLRAVMDEAQERFHVGLSYGWMPAGDAIVALGNVIDCKMDSPTSGQVLAGPQMSILGVDGTERLVIPGFFWGISVDRTGTMIAAARHEDGFQDLTPNVEIYSAQNGQLLLPIGPGSNPQFQP